MNYLINEIIIVNNEGFKLKDQDEIEIKLTDLPARLLEEMLTLQGKYITREMLLERVWENVGLQPSNSSLTQYISTLRKAFRTMGIEEDVILTIPKIGFKINKNIRVISLSPPEPVEADQFLLMSDSLVIDEKKHEIVREKKNPKTSRTIIKNQIVLLLILLIASTIFTSFIVWTSIPATNDSDLSYLDNVFGCNIYSTSHEENKMRLKKVEAFIEKNRTACPPHNMLIISTEKKPTDISGTGNRPSDNYSLCNIIEGQGIMCRKLSPVQQS